MTAGRRKGKSLRSGYTTGACAAAAAQAAAATLFNQITTDQVRLKLPDGDEVGFKISTCVFDSLEASCSVIKDAGDDPDITNGAEIWASVSWKDEPGISIDGGEGVGMITKPGLEMPVGMPAINPVPRQMITDSVKKATKDRLNGKGIKVTISVSRGEKLARKTLNPRLGIVGGISILGTTGIVIPYSIDAYTACISQALDVAVACGCREVVLTTGRRSEKFAQNEFALAEECFVQAGDFMDYSLKECASKRLAKVTIWGMIGKISKLAVGYLYTNISDSKVDIGFLTTLAKSCGVSDEMAKGLRGAVTANHFYRILPPEYSQEFCNQLCLLAANKCREHTEGRLEIECIMSGYNGAILGRGDARG
jgi:cobalt-precorrin-5B (C1)-methyltransferase